jgi:hypothetical protein
MKKLLLLLFTIASIHILRASDTLTVRQVFNFSVGDTFDYKEIWDNIYPSIYRVTYSRTVISQKYLNTSQDTLIYNGNWVITNLDSIAVFQTDTVQTPTPVTNFFDTASYAGRNSNSIQTGGYGNSSSFTLTEGLGETFKGSSYITNSGDPPSSDNTWLVYYSNGTQNFGTPYYILAGLNDIKITTDFKLSPNPTTGTLHLSLSEVNQNYQFILTDLLGNELLSQPISQTQTTLNISNYTSGIYLWRLVGSNGIIKSGKIVKE